jgi:succinate dehydrogenase flavin-adding protein (antitoxin of CptAB toxin-antitoxin module)
MNKEQATSYVTWLEADSARMAFWEANAGAWTSEVDATYREMLDKSDNLFYAYRAEATGKTVAQVAYAINESIHSARD